jgi:hypothetical protein
VDSYLTPAEIFTLNRLSSMQAALKYWEEDDARIEEMPKLLFSSDILSNICLRDNPNPKNLRYYFANRILND